LEDEGYEIDEPVLNQLRGRRIRPLHESWLR
jgi:hypothetical protein